MPPPTTDTDPMVPTFTTDLMATTPLARGPLMPSPLLMPMPTTDTTAMPVPMPTAVLDTEPMVPTAMLDTDLPMPTVPTPTELDTTVTIEPSNPTKDPPKIKTSSHKQQK